MNLVKICRRLGTGVLSGALTVAVVFSCSPAADIPAQQQPPAGNLELSPSIHTPNYTQGTNGTVNLTGLQNNDVFLVLANATGGAVSYGGDARGVIDMENRMLNGEIAGTALTDGGPDTTGGPGRPARVFTTDEGTTVFTEDFQGALVFPEAGMRFAAGQTAARAVTGYAAAVVGAQRAFYVDAVNQKKTATLRNIGTYCKIWVADDAWGSGPNLVTDAETSQLAQKFDQLYPLETKLLGYENGGGPGGNGGADGDTKIQILVYDIFGDYVENQNVGVAGYFFSGDAFQTGGNIYSNEAEIIYIDAYYMKTFASLIHSTLVHEFNHMINYNVKTITGGKQYTTWFTEMLSMLAEDVIGPLIGITVSNSGHPVPSRIPLWLASYWQHPPFSWNNTSAEQSLYYYASNFAFGAYLMRNFGGAALLSNIAKSNLIDKTALDTALRSLNGENRGLTFALRRFGEAFVYSAGQKPPNVFSFDNTVTRTVSGVTYTFTGFNIRTMQQPGDDYHGPSIFFVDTPATVSDSTIRVMGKTDWLGRSGSLSITLTNPGGADLFVMVR